METHEENEKGPNIREPLWTRGFIALLITQFMVALNDNLFRWLIIPIGKCSVGWSENPARILTIGGLVFLVPFLLFTSYAGYCSDRFSRRSVIIACKIAEVVIILFGIGAILSHSVPFMLAVLFFLGAQSAFFSPAKYSGLPMVVPKSRISEANGFYSATTLIACIGGQFLGGLLFDQTTRFDVHHVAVIGSGGSYRWFLWAGAILGVAVIGLISSLFVPAMKPAAPAARFPINPFYQTFADLRFLFRYRRIFWVAMASSFFWGFGALAQTNIDYFGTKYLMVSQTSAMFLLVTLTVGLAIGALIAGRWSGGRIEMGLVPFSAFFVIIFAVILALTPRVATDGTILSPMTFPFLYAAAALFLMGGAAEMFDIPLLASLQVESPPEHRGRILAAYNFYSFSAMALFIFFWGTLTDKEGLNLTAVGVWGVCALLTVPVFAASLRAFHVPLREFLARSFLSKKSEATFDRRN